MKNYWLERTELLLGYEGVEKLKSSNVLVVGLGGVGAAAAEMIARAGVGKMTIVDGDVIDPTNINRQLPAVHSKIGEQKAKIVGNKLIDINPELELTVIPDYIPEEEMPLLVTPHYDYVVDAIDTLSPKVELIYHTFTSGKKLVSSLGAGGRFDPTKITVSDIKKSYNCPLGRYLRKHLHRRNINKGFKVVFSSEMVIENAVREEIGRNKRSTVGTISYMPPLFGAVCASVVIRDLVGIP